MSEQWDALDIRLANWADWVMRREDGGLGFPKECPYTRLQGRSEGGFVPTESCDAWVIEKAVSALKLADAALWQALICRFVFTAMMPEQRWARCGCSKRMFMYRLVAAKKFIKKTLDDHCTKSV